MDTNTKDLFNYSQIEKVVYSDSDSADESEIESGYYATLVPSPAKPERWLDDYYYRDDKDLVRAIDLLSLIIPYLNDDKERKRGESVSFDFVSKVGNKHVKLLRSCSSKYVRNIAGAFLTVKTKKSKWVESWIGKPYPESLIEKANNGDMPFFIHVSGYKGKRGLDGFAVIIRDYTGIPIVSFSSTSDEDISVVTLEIDAVYKGLEIAEKRNFKNLMMYCTRERVSNKVESSLWHGVQSAAGVRSATTLNCIREISPRFTTFFIEYCGKFRNTSARYLAKHGGGIGTIEGNKWRKCGKLVDLLYEDASGRTGISFI